MTHVPPVYFQDNRLPDRFWNKGLPEPNSGCWLWSGANTNGYGNFSLGTRKNRRTVLAHRYAFSVLVRPLKAGELVLHRCDNPTCFNPNHMFVGSHADNSKDMAAKGRNAFNNKPLENSLKTHCKRGHPLSGIHLRVRSDGSRECRTCSRILRRDWKRRRALEKRSRVSA